MVEEKTAPKMELTEVMLAMDVVDTLRHRQSLAERELDSDLRDQAMIDKLRRIYAEQGLEVSDAVIAQGVAALREERFVYKSPPKSLQLFLARIYVRRGLWTKLAALAVILVLTAWLAYQFFYAGPAQRTRERHTRQLESVWKRYQAADLPGELDPAAEKLYRQAKNGIEAGNADQAQAAVSGLETLVDLPARLSALHQTIAREAKESAAKSKAGNLYRDGMAALANGDVRAAEQAARSLDSLNNRLTAEYSLQIVSGPNARSGVWRQSEANRNARNYYIIVEAVSPGGKRLSLPITSEEDGKTRKVTSWGLRVPAQVYDRIRRDKQDNGIIDQKQFGAKKRGYLDPDYNFPTTGGAITQW